MNQACLCTCEQGSAAVQACVGKRGGKAPGSPPSPKSLPPPSVAAGGRRALQDAVSKPQRGGPEGKGDPRGVKASLKGVRDCFRSKYAQLSAGCKAAIDGAGGLGDKMKPVVVADASSSSTSSSSADGLASTRAVALLDATQDVFEVMAEEDESTYSGVMTALLSSGAGIMALALAQPYAKRASARWQRSRLAAREQDEFKQVGSLSATQLTAYVDASIGSAEDGGPSRGPPSGASAALATITHTPRKLLVGLRIGPLSAARTSAHRPSTQLPSGSRDVEQISDDGRADNERAEGPSAADSSPVASDSDDTPAADPASVDSAPAKKPVTDA
jgi:hypothetical protein